MRTKTETVVTGFKVKAKVDSWRADYDGRTYARPFASFYDEDFHKFELPVTHEFIKQLIPGGSQEIEMEIKFVSK